MKPTSPFMNKSICLAASLLALNFTPLFSQPSQPDDVTAPVPAPPPGASFQQRLQPLQRLGHPSGEAPGLTKFNLDFPGGTPKELVAAIEKAMGRPLNAIIPTEDADLQMPPLKMNDVIVPQLFTALEAASLKQETRNTSMNYFGGLSSPSFSYTTVNTSYGFKTEGNVSDDSIWYFHVENPPQAQLSPPAPAKNCRFYQLAPYLERGLTVDDITTAIQTGWKMESPDTTPPDISYHKETKLLIAVGDPDKLQVIDDVLKALQPSMQFPGEPRMPPSYGHFQERLQNIIKKSDGTAGSSPEAQALMIEKNRLDSQPATNLPPPSPPVSPSAKPDAGQ
jgi:hypothetical protein